MELLGTFEAVAEIAIALTGFTGVVVALGRRDLIDRSPSERFFLRALVYWSLGTLFLSFLPAGLSGLAPATAWRIAHSTFLVFHTAVFVWFFRHTRQLAIPASPFGRVAVILGFGVILAEASVAFGFVLRAAPYLYLLALVWFLFLGATMFFVLRFPQLPDETAAQ